MGGGKFSNPKSTKMQDFAWELKNKEDAISGLSHRERLNPHLQVD